MALLIVRVPALGPAPSAVDDVSERGVRIANLLWRPLTERPSPLRPALAARVEASGGGLDVHLDADARWSDGAPILASDVVASARLIDTRHLVDVDAVGDRLVRFRGPTATQLASSLVPVRTGDAQHVDLAVTSGPYRLTEISETHALLQRNVTLEPQAQTVPERLEIVAIAEQSEALAELRAHLIDVVLEADERSVADVIAFPGPTVLAVPDTAAIVQLLVVRARSGTRTTVLTNRDAVARNVYSGLAQPGESQAWAKLTTEMSVHLLVNAENRLRRLAAGMIVADWEVAGVDASVEVVPWATFVSRLADGNFDAFLLSVRQAENLPDVLRQITGGHGLERTIELTRHAAWTLLGPRSLAHTTLVIALSGGVVR